MAATSAARTGHAASGAAAGYRPAIDLLRFVAAVGIVADHTMQWFWAGYPALGLFLILTGWFGVQSYLKSGGEGFWAKRAVRIAVPWLFWCAVYRVVHDWVTDAPFALLSDPFSLLVGPSIHLWFLPFVLFALVLIPALARDVNSVLRLQIASAGLVFLTVALGLIHHQSGLGGWLITGGPVPQPVPQWAFSLPLFLWGGLAALAHRMGRPGITLAAAAVATAILWPLAPDQASLQPLLCALIFEAVLRLGTRGASWMTAAAGYAFGLYLLHPLFALVGYKIFGASMPPEIGFLTACLGALAATAVLQRVPGLDRVV
jgi:peptidoglycan/LPS O-acetylase OafA/YrhL